MFKVGDMVEFSCILLEDEMTPILNHWTCNKCKARYGTRVPFKVLKIEKITTNPNSSYATSKPIVELPCGHRKTGWFSVRFKKCSLKYIELKNLRGLLL